MLKMFFVVLLSLSTVFATAASANTREEAEYFFVNKLDKALSLQFEVCEAKDGEPPRCDKHNVTIQPGDAFRDVKQLSDDALWIIMGTTGTTSDRRATFGNACSTLIWQVNKRGILNFVPLANNRIMCLRGR